MANWNLSQKDLKPFIDLSFFANANLVFAARVVPLALTSRSVALRASDRWAEDTEKELHMTQFYVRFCIHVTVAFP